MVTYRDNLGRFITPPGQLPQQRRQPDRTLVADKRRVLARRVRIISAMLRDALEQKGVVISTPIELETIALARIATRLEIITAEAVRGVAVDDDFLLRLTNALGRGLLRLGLRPTLLAPRLRRASSRPLSVALKAMEAAS